MTTTEVHTHPPVLHIVDTCPYCKKYGNIFVNDDVSISKYISEIKKNNTLIMRKIEKIYKK